MKHSMVILDNLIKEHGLHSMKVLDMHDEAQFECLPEEAGPRSLSRPKHCGSW